VGLHHLTEKRVVISALHCHGRHPLVLPEEYPREGREYLVDFFPRHALTCRKERIRGNKKFRRGDSRRGEPAPAFVLLPPGIGYSIVKILSLRYHPVLHTAPLHILPVLNLERGDIEKPKKSFKHRSHLPGQIVFDLFAVSLPTCNVIVINYIFYAYTSIVAFRIY